MTKSSNHIDKHVGARLKMRRMLIGMSQEKLGEALGLTFQQVQKYEKGTNRVSASRLQQIADVLSVTPAFFFDDAPHQAAASGAGFAEDGSAFLVEFLSTPDGILLSKAFVRIKDAKVRRKIIDLVSAMADSAPEEPEDDTLPQQSE